MTKISPLISQTEAFVKQTFIDKPHYSFNDWSVMYNHSVTVKDMALEIAQHAGCDLTITGIAALLHDIGKTYESSPEELHTKHQSLNFEVSEQFLLGLGLNSEQLKKIKNLIDYAEESQEMDIIKDADGIAFFRDKKLYMLYIEWAMENKLDSEIARKLGKYTQLHFDISRQLADPFFELMKEDWEVFLGKTHRNIR